MAKDFIKYAEDITTSEETVLRSKSGNLVAATNCTSLIWTVVQDAKARRYFQLRSVADREKCFGEFTLDEVTRLSAQDISQLFTAGERPCTH